MTNPRYYAGQLLLAMPAIGDPRFERAVIAVCRHDADGAMGLGVGAVVEGLSVNDLLANFEITASVPLDQPVHFGGPVEPQRGFVLHSRDWGGKDAVQVSDRWALSGSLDILHAIAAGRGPTRWLITLGYAGWSGGQLESEILHNAWHITPANDGILFDVSAVDRWRGAFACGGVDVALLSGTGGLA